MMRSLSFLLLLVMALPASATDYFVSAGATGDTNGSSWANAWPELNKINWAVVSAGDTVWIGGGTYTQELRCTASGSAASPIWIKAAQTNPYNGTIYVSNRFRIDGDYVTLYGAKSDSPSTNGLHVDDLESFLSTNINVFTIHQSNQQGGVYLTGITNQKVFFINSSWNGLIYTNEDQYKTDPGRIFNGILHKSSNIEPLEGIEIGWCVANTNACDGILIYQGEPNRLGQVKIHHCVSRYNWDDCIQTGGGTDVSYCVTGPRHRLYQAQHPDCIQISGTHKYFRAYNNILWPCISGFYCEIGDYTTYGGGTNGPDWYFYGNSFRYLPPQEEPERLLPGMLLDIHTQHLGGTPDTSILTITNLVIANNTIVGASSTAINLGVDQNYHTMVISNGANYGMWILNSLCWSNTLDTGSDADNAGHIVLQGTNNSPLEPIYYDKTNLYVDYNNCSTWSDNYGWQGTIYQSPSAFNTAFGFQFNTNRAPTFGDNYHLSSADTGAKNFGINLSNILPAGILSMMPDNDLDMDGNRRGQDGTWDIGAYEYTDEAPTITVEPSSISTGLDSNATFSVSVNGSAPLSYQWYFNSNVIGWVTSTNSSVVLSNLRQTNAGFYHCVVTNLYGKDTSSVATLTVTNGGLIVWLTFDDDFTDGIADDQSGNGRVMVRMDQVDGTNYGRWPVAAPGTNGDAAFFYMYYDGFADYGRSGDYGAITNVEAITNLTYATFSAWVYYTNAVSNYWPNAQTARILDVGHNAAGAWGWGHNDDVSAAQTGFWVFTNVTEAGVIKWPDNFTGSSGSTSNFHHYAVTIDCSSGDAALANYYCGTNYSNVVIAGIPGLFIPTTTLCAASNRYPWIAVGASTHFRTAPMWDCGPDYQPNTGWLHGRIDDIRIYDRVLSAEEISSLANAEFEPPVEAPALSITPTTLTVTTLSNASTLTTNFQVRNSGDTSEMLYTNTETADWMSLDPGNASSSGEWDTVDIILTRTVPGTNQADITVTSGTNTGSPATLTVTLQVTNGVDETPPVATNQSAVLRGRSTLRGRVTIR